MGGDGMCGANLRPLTVVVVVLPHAVLRRRARAGAGLPQLRGDQHGPHLVAVKARREAKPDYEADYEAECRSRVMLGRLFLSTLPDPPSVPGSAAALAAAA